MRIIEVRINRADFANTLAEMRQWLDRKNRPRVQFETEADGRGRLWLSFPKNRSGKFESKPNGLGGAA
jgi:hypothetical protein